MDIKTQTRRLKTSMEGEIINLNCFVQKNFEIGIVTTKHWGDLTPREEPLITFELEGQEYEVLLKDFIKEIKPFLKNYEMKY